MFRLRILGGFSLDGPSEASTFPVPQRRAQAVLAVLAVRGDVGCSRERLMALLWPDRNNDRSRQALRSTLHTVRHALGPESVSSAGELVRLDPGIVGSDVQTFAQALASSQLADAVRSYGGPLLDGFHVDGAPDFEHWLDGERTRLARLCLEALERLAHQAEARGARTEAAGWWARAVEQDPLNSHFVLHHARALAALGDRANAIMAAEAHTRRLREELDLEPDRDVLAKIEEMRRGETTSPRYSGAPPVIGSKAERTLVTEEPTAHLDSPVTPPPTGSSPAETPTPGTWLPPRHLTAVAALGAVVLLAVIGMLVGPLARGKPGSIALDSTAIAVLPFQVVSGDSATRMLARSMGALFELKVRAEFGRQIRYPGSVEQRWRQAGGTLDSAISEGAELSVARAVGAGRLVRGTVVARRDSIALSASLVDVARGQVRVTPVTVKGTVAQEYDLVDRLIVLLLARDGGYSAAEAPRLAQYNPEAIQAFLAGDRFPGFSNERRAFLHAALAADSNLVDAALELYAWGEKDSAALRYAWEHQDRLSERRRAYLQVLAAGHYGQIRTEAQRIAAYEARARRWPEWDEPWGDVGDNLINYGALASVPDWRRRAQDAFARMERHPDWVLWHLTELAFWDQDTTRARAAIDSLAARLAAGARRPGLIAAYRWRLAMLRADTAGASRVLSRSLESDKVVQFALTDGRGVAQADSVAAQAAPVAGFWWWARGRERPWREAWRRYGSPAHGISEATAPVFWALLLGPAEDTMALEGVRRLDRMADPDRTPRVGTDDRALARCWLTLWRLRHGDTTGARAMTRWLEGDPVRRYRFAGWARLIDALVTEADGGDAHAALVRMDSVMRELPLPTGSLRWDPTPAEVQNLMLARMLGRYGEPQLALAAVRRRVYRSAMNYPDALPEYLREEGRFAALVGDTAGAIRAYRHYLALRENPDPPWRAPWDSVRAALAALERRTTP